MARHRADNPCGHPARGRRQVILAGLNRRDAGTDRVDDVDEGLDFAWAAMQPIGMPGDHRAGATGAQVIQETVIAGTTPTGKRGDVVVDVDAADQPTETRRERFTIRSLTIDAEHRTRRIARNPTVDTSC